jgi:hypothetical protein
MRHHWLMLFTVFSLAGMACSDSGDGLTPAVPSTPSISDADVISALIASEFSIPNIFVPIFVRDSTTVHTTTGLTDTDLVDRLKVFLPSVEESTRQSFLARNSRRIGLRGLLRLAPGMVYYRFSDRVPIDSVVLRFSRVGFNSNGTQALVYVMWSGHLEGNGTYYWLRRYGARWEVEGSRWDFLT